MSAGLWGAAKDSSIIVMVLKRGFSKWPLLKGSRSPNIIRIIYLSTLVTVSDAKTDNRAFWSSAFCDKSRETIISRRRRRKSSKLRPFKAPRSQKAQEGQLLQTDKVSVPWETGISLEIIAVLLAYSLWSDHWGQTVDTVPGSWCNVTTDYRLFAASYKQWWQARVSSS